MRDRMHRSGHKRLQVSLEIPRAFTDFIHADAALQGAFETGIYSYSLLQMFRSATRHALAPHAKTRLLAIQSHEFDDLFFFQPKLKFNRLKRCAIFPRHLDDAVDVLVGKLICYVCTFHHSR